MARKARPARLSPVTHAIYLSWAGRACSKANRNQPIPVLNRWSLDLHLFQHAVDAGLVVEPDTITRPYSAYVAEAFQRDPEAIKAEARRYWRVRVKALAHDLP
jgi:hypothetical protein